ncbi:MAG TPA: hypothetical protein PKC99_13325 [Anaerolineales bacterium]|nr:hypothetical protein [Anaerolineales bacterium]
MTLVQIVAELCAQVSDLESVRKQRFLEWLHKHHRTEQPPTSETISGFLNTWLTSLPAQGLQWEVQLLQDEIAWWRNLSAARLWKMMKEECSE